ncbi:SMP-30/gluconolactonase/LRE family protein [Paraburkholderia lycopersici]|uniref:Gluconolactonase n=1 Tax=Paraburkholderia lycopersici TaxID=416944 RepID=A0A1G6X8Q1_9BURK|nr:SMP-30/gluconolactonase/LRE family protein [Paraburkholderia lycopersici]SDD74183.1 gluconolactonase [Paraburkholderia lycopersici]
MFAPPPAVQAEEFVRIPSEFHVKGRRSTWVDVQLHGADAPAFLEGPSFDREGNLWVVDIPWGRLFKITPDARVSCELEYDGEPNGLKFHRDGRAFIADCKNGLMVFDPATGKIEPFLERALVQRFKGLNDLVFASNGDVYFTDQGQTGLHDATGKLYRLDRNGRLDCLLGNVPSPNGLVLNEKTNTVFLAVTRDNAIWRVPLVRDGLVTKVGVYVQMSGGGGPDGVALAADGSLAVCHVGLGAVWIFGPTGEPVLRINSAHGNMTTNCAFGGPQNKRLFITQGCSILVADTPVAGARMYSHAEEDAAHAPGH